MSGLPPADTSPESALRELQTAEISYDGTPNNLAAYDPDKLKVLKSQIKPKKIVRFLPPEAAKLVEHFESQILLPEAAESEAFQPYWDPALRFDPKRRLDFILKLHRVGLVSLRRTPRSFIGAFFVKKKDPNAIRMVLDCRGTNRLHQSPPVTRLGSARCYGDLDLENLGPGEGWGIEADVNDAFYNFAIPELTHYFALNHPLTRAQWESCGVDAASVFDPNTRGFSKVDPDCFLYPCIEAVPMGWSWALFLCNEAVLTISRSFSPWNDGVFREKKSTPQLCDYSTCLGVYVDNITIVGRSKEHVAQRAQALEAAFKQADIPITWTQSEPVQSLESVGCVLDFSKKRLCNKPKRLWKFYFATLGLLRRNKLHGRVLQVWAGHYTSLCSHTPWGLSVLQHLYRFIEISQHKRVRVWPCVRHELKMACSLIWMTWRDLGAPYCRLVDVGDSSSSGYAMMTCDPGKPRIKAAMSVHEKWRFIPMPESLKQAARDHDAQRFSDALADLQQLSHQCSEPFVKPAFHDAQYAQWVVDSFKQGSWLATSAIRSQLRAKPHKRVDVDIPSLVEPVDPFFADPSNFRLLWARRWRDVSEHINQKECRVAVSSLRRASRVREIMGCRKLTLSDNLATVSCLSKGRSSSFKMNRLCQTAAAIQFGCGITWHIRHVETKRNVADEPSRIPERRHRGVRLQPPRVEVPASSGRSTPSHSSKQADIPTHVDAIPSSACKFFLELFAGSANLTHAVAQHNIPCLEPIEIKNGVHCDLRRRKTQRLIIKWIEKGIIGFVHLGTPCKIWSWARRGVRDSPATYAKEAAGVELALFSAEVIRTCNKFQIPYAIENPASSKLFSFIPLVKAIATGVSYTVTFDMCSYGEAFKKDTKMITSCFSLQQLEKHCAHRRHAVWLKGRVRAEAGPNAGKYVNKTELAGVYPEQLCQTYACVLSNLRVAHGDPAACRVVQDCWGTALRGLVPKQGKQTFAREPSSKAVKTRGGEEECCSADMCNLLKQQGGLTTFLDAIALGRNQKEAWKALQNKDQRHREGL